MKDIFKKKFYYILSSLLIAINNNYHALYLADELKNPEKSSIKTRAKNLDCNWVLFFYLHFANYTSQITSSIFKKRGQKS